MAEGISVGDTTQILFATLDLTINTVSFSSANASFSPNTVTLQTRADGQLKYALVDMTVDSIPANDADILVAVGGLGQSLDIPFHTKQTFVDHIVQVTNGELTVASGVGRRSPAVIGDSSYTHGDGISVGDTTQLLIHFDNVGSTPDFTEVIISSDHASFTDIPFTLPEDAVKINATFAISSDIFSNTMFNGLITFAGDVTLFDETDITLTAVDGNGITGVTYTVTQQTPSTYSLNFTLPSDAEGAFSVQATGMVLPSGQTVELAIAANPASPVVTYDTSVAVGATWGTPDYSVGEAQVAIPITFPSEVVVADAAVFDFTPVSPLVDADLEGLQAAINGDGTDWTLTVTVPLDVEGDIEIDVTGEVFKVSTHVYDVVTIAALTLAVNTIVPEVVRREQPGTYTHGDGYDVVWQFNVPVKFYEPTAFYGDNNATYLDHFVFSGAQLGQPTLYVWTGTGFPSLPLPDTLSADWTNMVTTTGASAVYLMRYLDDVPDTIRGCFFG